MLAVSSLYLGLSLDEFPWPPKNGLGEVHVSHEKRVRVQFLSPVVCCQSKPPGNGETIKQKDLHGYPL